MHNRKQKEPQDRDLTADVTITADHCMGAAVREGTEKLSATAPPPLYQSTSEASEATTLRNRQFL